ncbi:hypothetical protein SAMN05443634_108203 [Chishuiella changwenlii]|uniref:Lipoprotein n=1 Tax=Chishuiella changwenlii TaxID=1434701 RepID=A0A1M7A7P4_9FLAO|nr:hypothetical protein [Chishuiella changwenlii]GGF10064.1 hypothetical protein GCM10010984_29040 [Chishuiella changwenlii]SHL38713.1 hypothetical protein SAMN05443634_108203 [Chishuiella changwenlii]
MKKIILFSKLLILSLFIQSCNEDESFSPDATNIENNQIKFRESTENSLFFKKIDLNILGNNYLTSNTDMPSVLNRNSENISTRSNPWNGREVLYVTGTKTRMSSGHPLRVFSFGFRPEIARKYGLSAGYYNCEVWSFTAEVQLPPNTLVARALESTPRGYIGFTPHQNSEEFGVTYSMSSNGKLLINTKYILVVSNAFGQRINRSIPDSSFANMGTLTFPYQYIAY